MGKLTFKTKVALLFSLFSTLIIIVTGATFSVFYYFVVERDLHYSIAQTTEELVKENIVIKNGEIFYQPAKDGETISGRLRVNSLSALIYNANLAKIGIFGIYRNITTSEESNNATDQKIFLLVKKTGKPVFSHATLTADRKYDVYTFPLVSSGATVGIIQVARESDFINRVVRLSAYIMMLILPISICLSLLAGYLITKRSFMPLLNLIKHMQSIKLHGKPKRIDVQGSSDDEIAKLSEAYNQMLDRIGEGVRKQKEFIANASHELKTPLTSAASSLDLALIATQSNNTTDAKKEIELVRSDILDLSATIDSLLSLSRITEVPDVNPSSLSIREEVTKITKKLEEKINARNIKIELTGEIDKHILFPEEYLQIIILNILSNAIKYSGENTIVTIDFFEENGKGVLVIEDNGMGIEAEELNHIFERFYRGRNVKEKISGSGLGLGIIKEICDANGLDLNVSSTPGVGTKLTVSNFELSKDSL